MPGGVKEPQAGRVSLGGSLHLSEPRCSYLSGGLTSQRCWEV